MTLPKGYKTGDKRKIDWKEIRKNDSDIITGLILTGVIFFILIFSQERTNEIYFEGTTFQLLVWIFIILMAAASGAALIVAIVFPTYRRLKKN